MRPVPASYGLMMLLIGAVIGAVAALSKTSVSNTLIESLIVFISGSAGLYLLNRDNSKSGFQILRSIGTLGIFFVVSVVGVFAVLRYFESPSFYEWDNNLTSSENLAAAEIRGHFANLGIRWDEHTGSILHNASIVMQSSAILSCLKNGLSDAEYTSNVSKIYKHKLACKKSHPDAVEGALKFVSASFSDAHDKINTSDRALAANELSNISAALLYLSHTVSEIAIPTAPGCAITTDETQAAAMALLERMDLCSKTESMRLLETVRSHASSYSEIWGGDSRVAPIVSDFAPESGEFVQ